jgi:hypothetical protein
MLSRRINDNSKVVRMTTVGDATTCSVNFENFKGVVYDRNFFIIQATVSLASQKDASETI